MPGIIVSRPIFNQLFKLAHDEGLSINAFLTKLLETSTSENGAPQAAGDAPQSAERVDQVVDAGSTGRVGSESVRSVEGTVPAPAPASGNGHLSNGHSANSYIGETEKNAPAPVERAPQRSSSDGGDGEDSGIWKRVVELEGHKFSTSRGKKFSYKVAGEYVIVKESSARIPRSQFAKAEKMWPVKGPSQLVGVYAPSVVWAIMKEMVGDPVSG